MTNHLGEKVYQTYGAWRAAMRAIDADFHLDGDKDIASAFDKDTGHCIGEWDGETGIVCLLTPMPRIDLTDSISHDMVSRGNGR